MSLNETPLADRIHIGFFGIRNAGKSSLLNAVTKQELSIVSPTPGTTADPVKKTMELSTAGPVVIIDTPGFDDNDPSLGVLRTKKAIETLKNVDIAVLVTDAEKPLSFYEIDFINYLKEENIPFFIVRNKIDKNIIKINEDAIYISALTGENLSEFINKLAFFATSILKESKTKLLDDIVNFGDIVLLITPIDKSAPKGRLILPQQQVIRDVLDIGGVCITVKDTEIENALLSLKNSPSIAITDSQCFKIADKKIPFEIPLTSFSMLFARYAGILKDSIEGANAFDNLLGGEKILISEGCTHHRQCEDIGTVKLPKLIREYTGKDFDFSFTSGKEFPGKEKLKKYALCIHCGGCMLRGKEVFRRMSLCKTLGVKFTNYGVALSFLNNTLERTIKVFNL